MNAMYAFDEVAPRGAARFGGAQGCWARLCLRFLLFDNIRDFSGAHAVYFADLAADFRGEALRLLLFVEIDFHF